MPAGAPASSRGWVRPMQRGRSLDAPWTPRTDDAVPTTSRRMRTVQVDPNAHAIVVVNTPTGGELKLDPGREVVARVVATNGAGGAKISLGGQVVDVTTSASLRVGDEVRLGVTQADETGVRADQVVAGTALYQQSGTNPVWRSAVVARQGQLVVRVELESYRPTSSDALTQAAYLATTALAKAAALQDAGGAPR